MTTEAHASGRVAEAGLDSPGTVSLLKRLMHELTTLFRQEVALGTAEVVKALRAHAVRALSLVTGVAVLFAGFLMLLTSAVLALCTVVAPWLAALIIGALVTIAGGVLTAVGGKAAEPGALELPRSRESLRKDKDLLSGSSP